jgi:Na+/proline symporter
LYWKRTNRTGAVAAMVLGSATGLVSYYQLGWYTAALVGTAVSMVVVLLSSWLRPGDFAWAALNPGSEPERAPEGVA